MSTLKLAVLVAALLSVAQAAQPITTTANIDKDVLAGASAGVTQAAIQAAASGGSAARATGVGSAASKVVSLSTSPLLAGPRDLQNNAIEQRTQGSIQSAAGGKIPASNPSAATGAIKGVQSIATGASSQITRQQASTIATQAAIQSGTAKQATRVGQAGASLTGGSSVVLPGSISAQQGATPLAVASATAPGVMTVPAGTRGASIPPPRAAAAKLPPPTKPPTQNGVPLGQVTPMPTPAGGR